MNTRRCKTCGNRFELTQLDFDFCKKFNVEPLKDCFECNQKHHLAFRNERYLYKRKCDATGEEFISVYSPDKPYKVYRPDFWYGDEWDPMEYGQNYDFSRPFFEQFAELQSKVPRLGIMNVKAENSDYCNMTIGNKNCYLIFGGDFNQDCMFGALCMENRDTLDNDFGSGNELCYMIAGSNNCYSSQFAFDSKNCNNSYFISNCFSCSECILCANLTGKSYCISNRQLPKEEYFRRKKELINGSLKQQQKNFQEFEEMRKSRICKYANILASENCTGDYIKNSKNCTSCYEVGEGEDMRNIILAYRAKDAYNSSMIGHHSSVLFNMISCVGAYKVFCSLFTIESSNIFYSDLTLNSENLFGCISLRHKKYCILNKQYTKEEYEDLIARIKKHMQENGEWEEFFPRNLSYFGYNETTAMQYYPMKRQQAEIEEFKWHEEDTGMKKPQSYEIPDNIKDVSVEIINEILTCIACSKNFRITPQEFKFYQKMNIPIPKKCPDCRYKERQSLRNPKKLWPRNCMKCSAEIQSSYSPERSEIIYCEKCYLQQVF